MFIRQLLQHKNQFDYQKYQQFKAMLSYHQKIIPSIPIRMVGCTDISHIYTLDGITNIKKLKKQKRCCGYYDFIDYYYDLILHNLIIQGIKYLKKHQKIEGTIDEINKNQKALLLWRKLTFVQQKNNQWKIILNKKQQMRQSRINFRNVSKPVPFIKMDMQQSINANLKRIFTNEIAQQFNKLSFLNVNEKQQQIKLKAIYQDKNILQNLGKIKLKSIQKYQIMFGFVSTPKLRMYVYKDDKFLRYNQQVYNQKNEHVGRQGCSFFKIYLNKQSKIFSYGGSQFQPKKGNPKQRSLDMQQYVFNDGKIISKKVQKINNNVFRPVIVKQYIGQYVYVYFIGGQNVDTFKPTNNIIRFLFDNKKFEKIIERYNPSAAYYHKSIFIFGGTLLKDNKSTPLQSDVIKKIEIFSTQTFKLDIFQPLGGLRYQVLTNISICIPFQITAESSQEILILGGSFHQFQRENENSSIIFNPQKKMFYVFGSGLLPCNIQVSQNKLYQKHHPAFPDEYIQDREGIRKQNQIKFLHLKEFNKRPECNILKFTDIGSQTFRWTKQTIV